MPRSAAARPGRLLSAWLVVAAVGCSSRDPAEPLATVNVHTSRSSVVAGGPIDFTYRFEVASRAAFDGDYLVFASVVDADGRTVWSDDHEPPVPTSEWTPGQIVEYTRTQFVPRLARAGDVEVTVGLYRGDMRLPLAGPDPTDRDLASRAYRVAGLQVLPESEGIFVIYHRGWHRDEFDESTGGRLARWTERVASVSFENPRADAVLYLDYEARPEAFGDRPQSVAVVAGGEVLDLFEADSVERRVRRVELPAAALGEGTMAEVRLELDRTFVPASLPAGGPDERALGIRVYHVVVERR